MNLYGSDLNMITLAGAFLALFGAAELLYHKAGVRAEYTRKIVHAGTGLLTLLFPIALNEFWQVAVLCGSFLLLLLASRKWDWLRSINAVERDTLGSILYPIIVALLFGFDHCQSNEAMNAGRPAQFAYYFWLPILVMALCDPLAAVVGQRAAMRNPSLRGRKTWQGSVAFFAGAFVLSFFFTMGAVLGGTEDFLFGFARVAMLAASTTLAERWSRRGWDNFTIPVTAAAMLWLFEKPWE